MYKYGDITRYIIGVAMKVHQELGPGFQEHIYHRAMEIALPKVSFEVESEKEFDVSFQNEWVGTFRVDLFINKVVIVELKAVCGEMPKLFYTQTISYLKASGVEVGLILNFGNRELEFKRVARYPDFASDAINQS